MDPAIEYETRTSQQLERPPNNPCNSHTLQQMSVETYGKHIFQCPTLHICKVFAVHLKNAGMMMATFTAAAE